MARYLGIDTSNYTSSIALFDSESREMLQQRRLLDVKKGERGLRQSDAVFLHIKNLPALIEHLMMEQASPDVLAASVCPRDEEGSYMPCFKVGEETARSLAAVLGVPFYQTSHQAGHIAAAAFSVDRMDLLSSPFIAFHLSGGTTEAVLVEPNKDRVVKTRIIAKTRDISVGQVIDRVGVVLGLDFPCGKALSELASQSNAIYSPRVAIKERDLCLSGVENQCKERMKRGEAPQEVAAFCLQSVVAAVVAMTEQVARLYPKLPLLFAGGVASNSMLRQALSSFDAVFGKPEYSTDNAAGVALISYMKEEML